MKIIVDYGLLCFIERNKCPEVPINDWEKKYFKKIIDFSSVDVNVSPINDSYLAVDYDGYGYPFSCGKEQFQQGLEMLIKNIEQK